MRVRRISEALQAARAKETISGRCQERVLLATLSRRETCRRGRMHESVVQMTGTDGEPAMLSFYI
jgi:hypothetical protein